MKRLYSLFMLPLLALTACGPRYDGVVLELYSAPPVPVRVNGEEIEVAAGVAAAVDVRPLSSNQFDYYESDQLVLTSQDRDILRVEPTEAPRRFVIIGVAPGETCVDIEVDYEDHGCIPATVIAATP
ncbi:MAG TPA: hypothetical protein VGB85_23445 [Nannocystis sp.]